MEWDGTNRVGVEYGYHGQDLSFIMDYTDKGAMWTHKVGGAGFGIIM